MYIPEVIINILTNNAGIEHEWSEEDVLFYYSKLWMPTDAEKLSELSDKDWDGFANEINNIWENLEDDPDYYHGHKKEYARVLHKFMWEMQNSFIEYAENAHLYAR